MNDEAAMLNAMAQYVHDRLQKEGYVVKLGRAGEYTAGGPTSKLPRDVIVNVGDGLVPTIRFRPLWVGGPLLATDTATYVGVKMTIVCAGENETKVVEPSHPNALEVLGDFAYETISSIARNGGIDGEHHY